MAIAIVIAIALTLMLPARYESVARLQVDFGQTPGAGVEALAQAAGVTDPTRLQTQVAILETDSIAWDVIHGLKLDQGPDALPRRFFWGPTECGGNSQSMSASSYCRQALLDEFHKRLHVEALPRTQIIEIHYRSRSPELAAAVANALAENYVERNFQSQYQSSMRTSRWLATRLDGVRKNAQESAQKYIAYQKQTGLVGTESGQNLELSQVIALNQQLMVAEAERIVKEARYRTAESGDPEALLTITQGTTLQSLHAEQVTLENQYAQLDAKFGDAYPRVIQVKEQLLKAQQATNEEMQHARLKIKSDYEAAVRTEDLLHDAFDRQKQKIYGSNDATVRLALMKRDVDANNELYEQVVRKMSSSSVLAGIGGGDITVIDPAEVPARRAEPHPVLNLFGGVVIGSLCGLALCGVLEGFDGRIRTMNDVAELCPLPGASYIPRLVENGPDGGGDSSGRARIAALDWPASATAESYRSLRTALLHSNGGEAPKVILVTSPDAGEGKSEVCLNLAAVFAQMNRHVLLVDADLRHSDLSRLVSNQSGGLAAALAGESATGDALPGVPRVTLLAAGAGPANPADILESKRMTELIEDWRQHFDIVILDAPHLIGVADAVVLSTRADAVLLVVKPGQGRRADIEAAVEVLLGVGAKLTGAVVKEAEYNHASV